MDRHDLKSILIWMGRAAMGASLLAWLVGMPLSARGSPNAGINLDTYILNPPNAVTDLSASAVGSQNGDIQLVWTAPSNANGARIDHYLIRFATYSASSIGSSDVWWTQVASAETQVSPAQAPGVAEFKILSNFNLGVTYYFGIKAVDVDNQISSLDQRTVLGPQAASQPLNVGGTSPPTPNNFVGVALSTTSIRWSWDASATATFYRVERSPDGALIGQVSVLNLAESNLSANTPYGRSVRAGNIFGVSSPTGAKTVFTLAADPTGLSASLIGFADATLLWQSGGNPNNTQYKLERSKDNNSFVVVQLLTNLTHQDTGLEERTTYYYRVSAINGDGIQTAFTPSLKVVTLPKIDRLAPDQPLGLKGSLDPTRRAFTLIWEDVTQNADGTPITDLVGYNVYRRSTLTGSGIKLNPVPLIVTAFADRVDGQTFYYSLRAVDTSNNESKDSMLADSSPDANVIFLGADGLTHVMMPESVNDILRSGNNKYGVPLTIALQEAPVSANPLILRTVRLALLRGDSKTEINDLSFTAPKAVVAVGYNLVNGEVARGVPSIESNEGLNREAPLSAQVTPDKLSLYWNNGVTWVKVDGTVDKTAQVVRIKTSYLGDYQLRMSEGATSVTLDQGNVYPRVFTPNDDGHNDRVYFVLLNPNKVSVTGQIFDLAGRLVATLKPPEGNIGIATTLIWDGKDTSGSVVPSGAYIYKIEGEGKTFTGTVAVAR